MHLTDLLLAQLVFLVLRPCYNCMHDATLAVPAWVHANHAHAMHQYMLIHVLQLRR